MNIIFYGGRQTGALCLLTLLAKKENVVCVVPVDEAVEKIAEKFSLKVFKPKSLNSGDSAKHLKSLNLDLLVCCHGREILKKEILEIPEKGCINLHPCLYKYKGARPIERLLEDKNPKASIGVHYMIEEVDMGDVITEIFVDVSGCSIPIEVYNKLYIYYSLALIDAIDKIKIKI